MYLWGEERGIHLLFSTTAGCFSFHFFYTARGRCFLTPFSAWNAAHIVAFVQGIVLRERSSYMQIETHGTSMCHPSQLTV